MIRWEGVKIELKLYWCHKFYKFDRNIIIFFLGSILINQGAGFLFVFLQQLMIDLFRLGQLRVNDFPAGQSPIAGARIRRKDTGEKLSNTAPGFIRLDPTFILSLKITGFKHTKEGCDIKCQYPIKKYKISLLSQLS